MNTEIESLSQLVIDTALLAWQKDAACAEVGDDFWYPEKRESSTPAKFVCSGCEVRRQCLEYALARNERHGIWGGKSARERRALQSERKAA